MNGFSIAQLKKLSKPIDARHIHKRQHDGRELSYIPGWFAVAEANAIFGYAGWDRETVHLERLYEKNAFNAINCGYLARVRITVRASETIITREGTGFGFASATAAADAHERALKSAETDATKRALCTFGNRFGLSLYGPASNGAPAQASGGRHTAELCLLTPEGSVLADDLSPEGYASGFRQLIEKILSVADLERLLENNKAGLGDLRRYFPQLKSAKGNHFADILENLAVRRKETIIAQESLKDIDSNSSSADLNVADAAPEPLTNPDAAAPAVLPTQGPVLGTSICAVLSTTEAPLPSSSPISTPLPAPALVPPRLPRPGTRALIDKSILSYANERRIRNKQHLGFVASKPCLICEEIPCHAHHLTFAQPRGLSIKVSDEFTVPLCIKHHNEVHQIRPERAWWNGHGIDALEIAQTLWEETLKSLVADAI